MQSPHDEEIYLYSVCYSKLNSINLTTGLHMKRITGILLIAISAASFGTLAIFGRFLYAEGMDIFTVLFLRFGIAALLMTFILFLRKESLPKGKILLQLIGMG